MTDSAYQANHIKASPRDTRRGGTARAALYDIVAAMYPITVPQVFYQATVHSIVEKTETGHAKVQTDLVWMRSSWTLPYDWLTDSTRWQRKPRSFLDPEDALLETAQFYRKSLWAEIEAYVEVWLEKDALAGVVYPITTTFDVPLMVARGYASLSFLYSAAEYVAELDCPIYVYHLGDFDPSGLNAGEKIEQTLRELVPYAQIFFERIAATPAQIADWNLPTRPTKSTDRAKSFGADSVELDALEPRRLRDLGPDVMEQHLLVDQYEVLKAAEESERQQIAGLPGMLGKEEHDG